MYFSRTRDAARRGIGAALVAAAVSLAAEAHATDAATHLAALYPSARVERATLTLTEGQRAAVREATGEAPPWTILRTFQVWEGDALAAVAVLDTHRVRTLPETLLIIVTPSGAVHSVAVLDFREPHEYRASGRWLAQFTGRDDPAPMRFGHNVDGIAGATLTARATHNAVRRALALRPLLLPREAGDPP